AGQRAVQRQVERAIASEHGLLAVAHHEEAIALNGHIGALPRRLQRALALDGVNAADQHAETDLLGIDPATPVLWPTCAAQSLAQNVLECHARLLETGGIYVGYVIAHHVHEGLMILQAR